MMGGGVLAVGQCVFASAGMASSCVRGIANCSLCNGTFYACNRDNEMARKECELTYTSSQTQGRKNTMAEEWPHGTKLETAKCSPVSIWPCLNHRTAQVQRAHP